MELISTQRMYVIVRVAYTVYMYRGNMHVSITDYGILLEIMNHVRVLTSTVVSSDACIFV